MLTKKQKQQHERANRCCSARIGRYDLWLCCAISLTWWPPAWLTILFWYLFDSSCGDWLGILSGVSEIVCRLDSVELSQSHRRHVIRPNPHHFLHLPGICTISRPFSRSTLGQPTTHGGRWNHSILEFYHRDTKVMCWNGRGFNCFALMPSRQVLDIDGTMPLRLIWCRMSIFLVDQVALIYTSLYICIILHTFVIYYTLLLYSCDSLRCMMTPDFLPKKLHCMFFVFHLNFLACHCRFSVVKHACAMAAWPRNLQKPELFKVCRQIGRLAEGSPEGGMM